MFWVPPKHKRLSNHHKNLGEGGKTQTVPLHIPIKMERKSENKLSYYHLSLKICKVIFILHNTRRKKIIEHILEMSIFW